MNRSTNLLATLLFTVVTLSSADAQTLYWDINGANSGATDNGDGTAPGTWGTDAFWTSDQDGLSATGGWTSGNTAVFSAGTNATGDSTITINGTQTANGITLEEGNQSLTTGTLFLSGGSTMSIAPGKKLTITASVNPTVGGVPGFSTVTGGGTLRLQQPTATTNQSTGAITINGGSTVSVSQAGDLGLSGDVTLDNGTFENSDATNSVFTFLATTRNFVIGSGGGTLSASGASGSILIYGGTITGAGPTLTKTGDGELRVNTTNTAAFGFQKLVLKGGLYTLGQSGSNGRDGELGAVPTSFLQDQITLDGGGLRFNTSGIAVNANRGITLAGVGGSLVPTTSATIPGKITGSGALATGGVSSTGTITFSNTGNDYTGATTINTGVLQFAKTGAMSSGDISAGTGATLAVNVGGAGEWNANTSGLVSIGDLIAGANSAGTANKITWNTGSALGIDTTSGSVTYSGAIGSFRTGGDAVGLRKLGTNTLTLTANNTFTGVTTISAGTLQLGNGGTTGSLAAAGTITNNGTLTINRSNDVTQGTDFSGSPISGTGSLTQAGTGTTTLNAVNTYTGKNFLNAGKLVVSKDTNFGAVPGSNTADSITFNGGTLRAEPGAANGNLLGLAGTRRITVNSAGGTIEIQNGDVFSPGSGLITNAGRTVTITGNGGIYSTGYTTDGGTTNFAASQTAFTGKWKITGGAIFKSYSNKNQSGVNPGSLVQDFFTLDNGTYASNSSHTVDTNKGFTLGPGGGTFNTNLVIPGSDGGNCTVPSGIAGSGSLTKMGSNTLTLQGVNTFTGDINANGGTLTFDTTSGFASNNINVNSGTLTINVTSPQTFSSVNVTGGRINFNFAGGAGANPITLNPGASGAILATSTTGPINISNNIISNVGAGTVDLLSTTTAGRTLNLTGQISGNGPMTRGLNLSTSSTIGLSGDNSAWTGGLTFNSGILSLGHKNALGSTAMNVNSLATASTQQPTLQASVGTLTGANAIPNNIAIDKGTSSFPQLILNGANNFDLSGVISDKVGGTPGGAIIKSDNNVVTLTGASTYTGGTTVSGGRLIVSGTSAKLGTGDVTIATGGILEIAGGVANAIADNKMLTIAGGAPSVSGFANLAGGINEIVASLTLGSTVYGAGTYGSTLSSAAFKNDEFFAGTGILIVAAACAPGDLNCDGHVDAGDYVFWRKTNGPSTDYNNWRANFGNPPGSGSSLGGQAVPEPGTLLLALFAVFFALTGRRHR